MVHTQAPWSSKYRSETVVAQVDIGELAARLWSPDTWHRLGNVIYMDSFEEGVINWSVDDASGAGSVTISTDRSRLGGNSIKCVTPAASTAAVGIEKAFVVGLSGKLGVEIHVNCTTINCFFQVDILKYTGSNLLYASIRWRPDTGTLSYRDSTNTWTNLDATLWQGDTRECWVPLKLVADLDALEYISVRLGDNIYDLTDEDMYSTVSTQRAHSYVLLHFENTTASERTGYIDDVIITVNEV